jgi:hypothetical protein
MRQILFTFNTQGCSGDYAVSYNNCGQLAEGPNGGGVRGTYYEACGDWVDFTFSLGAPNPNYNPNNCPPSTPIQGEPEYSVTKRFDCGKCE